MTISHKRGARVIEGLASDFSAITPVAGQDYYATDTNEKKTGDGVTGWSSLPTNNVAGGGAGTVTSVDTGTGLTGGPITVSGTISIENTTVIPGAYSNPDITIGADGRITAAANGSTSSSVDSLRFGVRNVSGAQINKGTPVYNTGWNAGTSLLEISPADASSAATLPSLGLVVADIPNNSNGEVIQSGILEDFDTSAWAQGAPLYVAVGGGLTDTKPIGAANGIQKVAQVLDAQAVNGDVIVFGVGRVNDVPNIATDNLWVGDANGVPESVSKSAFLAGTGFQAGDPLDNANFRSNTNSNWGGSVAAISPDFGGRDRLDITVDANLTGELLAPTGVAGLDDVGDWAQVLLVLTQDAGGTNAIPSTIFGANYAGGIEGYFPVINANTPGDTPLNIILEGRVITGPTTVWTVKMPPMPARGNATSAATALTWNSVVNDAETYLILTAGTAVTLTPAAGEGQREGDMGVYEVGGTGSLTVTAGAGVTLKGKPYFPGGENYVATVYWTSATGCTVTGGTDTP